MSPRGHTLNGEIFANIANFKPICENLSCETQRQSLHAKVYLHELSKSSHSWKFIQWKVFSNFIAKISFQTLQSEPNLMSKKFRSQKLAWASSCLILVNLLQKVRVLKNEVWIFAQISLAKLFLFGIIPKFNHAKPLIHDYLQKFIHSKRKIFAKFWSSKSFSDWSSTLASLARYRPFVSALLY